MLIDAIVPQMGESVTEATILKWLKNPGDRVLRDEPLFEISTDKVDAEIPATASGILHEIRVPAGATIPVNTVAATIEVDAQPGKDFRSAQKAMSVQSAPPVVRPESEHSTNTSVVKPPAVDQSARLSPLVRKLAREHAIDLSRVPGTGLDGRVTKDDILAFINKTTAPVSASTVPRTFPDAPDQHVPAPAAPLSIGAADDLVPMTSMRRIIAQRMVESQRINAHVYSVFQVDVTRIVRLRNKYKADLPQRDAPTLTFTPFFVRAACAGLQRFPILNASVEGDNIRYHGGINMGIAVSLDWGLIVPVIRNADNLSLKGLQHGIGDLSARARSKQLRPEEIEGSTFTTTNLGKFGSLFGLPIIHQPNAAILGIGGIQKCPMVMADRDGHDAIAIRSMVHLTLGYDHRITDGAVADQFMHFIKDFLQDWAEDVG